MMALKIGVFVHVFVDYVLSLALTSHFFLWGSFKRTFNDYNVVVVHVIVDQNVIALHVVDVVAHFNIVVVVAIFRHSIIWIAYIRVAYVQVVDRCIAHCGRWHMESIVIVW